MQQEPTDFSGHTWMPEFTPPWDEKHPELDASIVRDIYRDGTWAYAVGAPACSHKRYGEAIDAFRKANPGLTPWWVRSVADVEAVLHGCTFDPSKGVYVLKFLKHLVLADDEWAGKPLKLIDWEIYDLLMPLYSWRNPEGLRRFTKGSIWTPKKQGKALDCNTQIATPLGWARMGDLQAGDEVYGSGGIPTRIIATSEIMTGRPCFRITFEDNSSVVCDADHEWPVLDAEGRQQFVPARYLGRYDAVARSASCPCWLKSVERCASVPVKCIQVDAPDALYLCGENCVPTHNSALAAGLGILHLCAMRAGAPLIWIAAVDRKQASNIYKVARCIAEMTPCLCDVLRPIGGEAGIKQIAYDADHGMLEALSEVPKSKEGMNWSFGLFDELHVGSRELWSVLVKGAATRTEPLMLSLSTAGKYDPSSIGWEQWQYALKVSQGVIVNDEFFSLMYRIEPPKNDPLWWTREEFMVKANPSLDVVCKRRFVQGEVKEAQDDPIKVNDVLRYHFNVWTHQASAMIQMHEWGGCAARVSAEAFEESLKGRTFYGGLDLSQTDDLTAFAMWFPPAQVGEPHKILVDFFLPRTRVEALQEDTTMSYVEWADLGLIHLTDGVTVNYEYVRSVIEDRCTQFKMKQIGFDPYNASETSQKLIEIHGKESIIEVRQGFLTMGPASRFVKEHIQNATLQHPNHPILNWHVSNAQAVFQKSGLYMVTKSDGKTRLKVDGFVAMIIAGSRAMFAPPVRTSTRGLVVL